MKYLPFTQIQIFGLLAFMYKPTSNYKWRYDIEYHNVIYIYGFA